MMIFKTRVEDSEGKSELCHPVYCVSFGSVEGKCSAFPVDWTNPSSLLVPKRDF